MTPIDEVQVPSPLIGQLAGLLEEHGVNDMISDSIVRILEWWEAGAGEITNVRGGFLLVGHNPESREVVINLDRDRTGHLTFSPAQARDLAKLLIGRAELLDAQPAK